MSNDIHTLRVIPRDTVSVVGDTRDCRLTSISTKRLSHTLSVWLGML